MQVEAENVTKVIKIEDEEIVIKKFSGQDYVELEKIIDPTEKGIQIILKAVIKWSFKNNAEAPMAINKDTLLKLRADILQTLIVEVTMFNLPIKSKKE